MNMKWELMGFAEDPFKTQPITMSTLDLYTGNEEKIKKSEFVLQSDNLVMVVEGSRGVGTTSFANYLRFKAQAAKRYFTPESEIRVEPNWNADTLLAAVISNIVATLELHFHSKIKDLVKFKEAKALVRRVTETYRSFGATIFGVGASYGGSGGASQPMVMPTQMLANYLEDLVAITFKLGFKHGLLIQLNNLDVGVVQNEKHLMMLFNVMRDYFQMPGTSWMLVGDQELRKFIAQNVDRLDDIVTFEVDIEPLAEKDYLKLIKRRVEYFKVNNRVKLPVDEEVWLYLFKITKGRLRYIFGMLSRLMNTLQLGVLIDRLTLDLAQPAAIAYAKERVQRFHLTVTEEAVLKVIVQNESVQVKDIVKSLGKKGSYISKVLAQLVNYRLVAYRKEWRNHFYYPSIEASIAYQS